MNDTIVALLQKYSVFLQTFNVPAARQVDRAAGPQAVVAHLQWMIAEMLLRADPAKAGMSGDKWSDRKVNRWLGFLQGSMWALGYTGITNLRDDSRHLYPDERSISPR